MTAPQAILMPLSDLHEWELNPRRGLYRNLPPLIASIQEHGIQEPLHVWFHRGQYLILQGHRRRKAAEELGLPEVPVIVAEAKDERAALALLMELQIEHDEFDPVEEAVGLRTLVDLGDTAKEIGQRLNRSETWVQLRLDILRLPDEAQDAVAKRVLDLRTVQLLLQLDRPDIEQAVQAVLHPEFSDEPLEGTTARLTIQNGWIERSEARRTWLARVPTLKKQYKAKQGYSVIEDFAQSEQFCTPHGHPCPGYRYSDETIDRRELEDPSIHLTWGDLARKHEHAVYIVSAFKSRDGVVSLVNERVLRDAEAALAEQGGATVLRLKPRKKAETPAHYPAADADPLPPNEPADTHDHGEGWTVECYHERSDPRCSMRTWVATLDTALAIVRHRLERDGHARAVIEAGVVE